MHYDDVLDRISGELGETPGVYSTDLGCGEGTLPSPQGQERHAQVRPHLPLRPRRPSLCQEQGQGL